MKGAFLVGGEEVLSLKIEDADIFVDLVGSMSLVEDTVDNQYFITELASNISLWNIDLVGSVDANLPMYFPTDSIPFGGTDKDRNGDGYGDHVLHVDGTFRGNNDFDLNIAVPKFDLSAAFGLFKLLNDPQNIVDGFNGFFDGLADGIDKYLEPLNLPMIGDALSDAPEFLRDLKTKVVPPIEAALAPGIAAGKTTIEILQEEIIKSIGGQLFTQDLDAKWAAAVPIEWPARTKSHHRAGRPGGSYKPTRVRGHGSQGTRPNWNWQR